MPIAIDPNTPAIPERVETLETSLSTLQPLVIYRYETNIALQAADVPSEAQIVSIAGREYTRATAEPTHTLKEQSGDGAWWELSETDVLDTDAAIANDAATFAFENGRGFRAKTQTSLVFNIHEGAAADTDVSRGEYFQSVLDFWERCEGVKPYLILDGDTPTVHKVAGAFLLNDHPEIMHIEGIKQTLQLHTITNAAWSNVYGDIWDLTLTVTPDLEENAILDMPCAILNAHGGVDATLVNGAIRIDSKTTNTITGRWHVKRSRGPVTVSTFSTDLDGQGVQGSLLVIPKHAIVFDQQTFIGAGALEIEGAMNIYRGGGFSTESMGWGMIEAGRDDTPAVGEDVADDQIVLVSGVQYQNTSGGTLPMPASFPATGFVTYTPRQDLFFFNDARLYTTDFTAMHGAGDSVVRGAGKTGLANFNLTGIGGGEFGKEGIRVQDGAGIYARRTYTGSMLSSAYEVGNNSPMNITSFRTGAAATGLKTVGEGAQISAEVGAISGAIFGVDADAAKSFVSIKDIEVIDNDSGIGKGNGLVDATGGGITFTNNTTDNLYNPNVLEGIAGYITDADPDRDNVTINSTLPTLNFIDGALSASINADNGNINYDTFATTRDHIFKAGNAERFRMDTSALAFQINSVKVLGVQQAAIADSVGGDESGKINDILAAMRTHGLIAT